MKKIYLLIGCVLLVGCTSKSSVEPEETVIPTIEPTAEITPEPTKETVDYEFKTVSINGLFDVGVRDPLPEQMVFETKEAVNGLGKFSIKIKSSVTVPCETAFGDDPICEETIFAFRYGNEELLNDGGIGGGRVDDEDIRLIIERENEETLYVWRCWMCNRGGSIKDGGGPDYYYEEDFDIFEEEVISFSSK